MATKTLILRPVEVTATQGAQVSLYPRNIILSNAHTLVNEEVADDDATYVLIHGVGESVNYNFIYEKPVDLVAVTNLTIHAIEKLESGTDKGNLYLYIDDVSPPLTYSGNLTTSEYTDFISFPANQSAYEYFTNATESVAFRLKRSTSSVSSKSSPVRTTQVYVEITYETSASEGLYLKENGTWTSIPYTIYQKQNGVWVQTDSSVFENGQIFELKDNIKICQT